MNCTSGTGSSTVVVFFFPVGTAVVEEVVASSRKTCICANNIRKSLSMIVYMVSMRRSVCVSFFSMVDDDDDDFKVLMKCVVCCRIESIVCARWQLLLFFSSVSSPVEGDEVVNRILERVISGGPPSSCARYRSRLVAMVCRFISSSSPFSFCFSSC